MISRARLSEKRRITRANATLAAAELGITKKLCRVLRVLVLCYTSRRRAERAEICRRYWRGYHRQRTGFVLAIEWCRL